MPVLGIVASQNYPRTFSVDFLIIAGGGGGAACSGLGTPVNGAGGGGAGGYRNSTGTSGANSSAELSLIHI